MDLKDMVAIVTGAARGMGKIITKEILDAGGYVAICDINEELIKQTGFELKNKYQSKVIAECLDVSKKEKVNKFVKLVEKKV